MLDFPYIINYKQQLVVSADSAPETEVIFNLVLFRKVKSNPAEPLSLGVGSKHLTCVINGASS